MRMQPRFDGKIPCALLMIALGASTTLRAQPAPKADPAEQEKPAGAAEPGSPARPEPAHDEISTPARPGGLRMTRAVICTTIDGYEKYRPLRGSAQTSEEKLLVYYRPLRYTVDYSEESGLYRAHLVQDNVLRRRGRKEVLRQKKKVVEYEPKSKDPLGPIYIKSSVSLKGLTPGEYELTIVLYDALDPSAPPARQVVPFKVIPPFDPRTKAAPSEKRKDPSPDS